MAMEKVKNQIDAMIVLVSGNGGLDQGISSLRGFCAIPEL